MLPRNLTTYLLPFWSAIALSTLLIMSVVYTIETEHFP
jgi:hypothetical protein